MLASSALVNLISAGIFFIQIIGCPLALQPEFSDEYMKSHRFSLYSAFFFLFNMEQWPIVLYILEMNGTLFCLKTAKSFWCVPYNNDEEVVDSYSIFVFVNLFSSLRIFRLKPREISWLNVYHWRFKTKLNIISTTIGFRSFKKLLICISKKRNNFRELIKWCYEHIT